MSGEMRVEITLKIGAQFVKLELNGEADQANLLANGGAFSEEYVPVGVLSTDLHSSDGTKRSGKVSATGLKAKAAIQEFYRMSEALKLFRRCFDGTYTDKTEGISGSDRARTNMAGATYDVHDGSGPFVITAPAPEVPSE